MMMTPDMMMTTNLETMVMITTKKMILTVTTMIMKTVTTTKMMLTQYVYVGVDLR